MPGEHVLRVETIVPLPLDEVFPFFSDASNLGRITPPELGFRIDTPLPVAMKQGALIDYTVRLFGLPMRWQSLISEWDPPHGFVDEQLKGPYAQWIHRHSFHPDGKTTVMVDEVRYRLPLWPVGELGLPLIKLQLKRIFSFREKAINELLLAG